MRDRELTSIDEASAIEKANREATELRNRAGI